MKDFEATETWPLYQSRFAYFSRIKVNKIPSFFQFQKRKSAEERLAILSLSLSTRNPFPLPPPPPQTLDRPLSYRKTTQKNTKIYARYTGEESE
jgi:hypothetical protein